MSILGKKLAIANFNSGRYQITADLCNPPTKEATEIQITVPKDNYESFFYELSNIGLAPKDVIVWPKDSNYDPQVPDTKDLSDIGNGHGKYNDISRIVLTVEGIQKMVLAGVKHPVLDAFAEHHHMKQPKSHLEKLK